MRHVIMVLMLATAAGVFAQEPTAVPAPSALPDSAPGQSTTDVNTQLNKFASDFLDRAILGDIIPLQGQAERVTVATATQIYVPPKTASVVQSTSIGAVTSFAGASQTTQNLLTSGDPASVIVGNRLLRTRVVGTSGAVGGATGIQFNTQSRGWLAFGFR